MIWSHRSLYAGSFALAIMCGWGCGRGSGDVSGKVYFGKKTLVYGSVLMVTEDRTLRQGNIKPDGSYSIPNVPAGEVHIAVISVDPRKTVQITPAPDPKIKITYDFDVNRWFEIPEKYGDPKESGLSITVSPGSNRHDIHLH